MKGYKAMYVDSSGNLYCMPDGENTLQFYEVGKTYKMKDYEVIFCRSGFHYCINLKDCFNFYPFSDLTAICEIEAGGKIQSYTHKSVCSEITIKRILSTDEVKKEAGKLIKKSSLVEESEFVEKSKFVFESKNIFESRQIFRSENVEYGENITNSKHIHGCYGVRHSHNIAYSQNVDFGEFVNCSTNIDLSKYIAHSHNISVCRGVSKSHNITKSNGVFYSDNIIASHYISNSYNLVECLFCNDLRNKHYYIFNEKSTKERVDKIKDDLLHLDKRFYPNFVFLDDRNELQEQSEYNAYMPLLKSEEYKEFRDYIFNLPEFDKKIFNRLCGRFE